MVNQYLKPNITTPSSLNIVSITKSCPMIVTAEIANPTTEVNTYIVGMAVRLMVPKSYGMYQANNLVGTIIALNGLVFTLNIDSSQFDPFVIPTGTGETPASLAPNGSRNLQYNNNTNAVPFQAYDNIGN